MHQFHGLLSRLYNGIVQKSTYLRLSSSVHDTLTSFYPVVVAEGFRNRLASASCQFCRVASSTTFPRWFQCSMFVAQPTLVLDFHPPTRQQHTWYLSEREVYRMLGILTSCPLLTKRKKYEQDNPTIHIYYIIVADRTTTVAFTISPKINNTGYGQNLELCN